MKNNWILDVLTDLRGFATANGLPRLAEQLDDTLLLAACELVSSPEGETRVARTQDELSFVAMLEALEKASELCELQAISERLRDYFQVDHLVYHWVSGAGTQYGCGTYSPEWVARYIERDYIRTDPVVLGCYQRFHPVDWKMLDWSSKAAQAFQAEALAHGVGNQGFSVPIRGPSGQFALFTVSHHCDDATWERRIEAARRELILVGHYFNEKALEFEPDRAPEAARALSPREVDAMTFLAMGYSRAQVANTLSISEHTLRVYIESARFKLGAANTTHAVARALQHGLIIV